MLKQKIVLATLNARYAHSSFGLRYLLANMGPLRAATVLREFGIHDNTIDVLAAILAYDPAIVGLGVYIWNVEPLTRLVSDLKRARPEILVVLGGPEVSYEAEEQTIVQLADYVISGEADCAFGELCCRLLNGEPCHEKYQYPPVPTFEHLEWPYELYDSIDIANRVIYVEASRGCPYSCEFCLSALEIPVRLADVAGFLREMQKLLDRGARRFKFVDRTFNLNLRVSRTILEFFLDRMAPGMFLHFEMIPDRLPEDLRRLIAQFPPGALQFEIGIQSFNDEVGKLINRKQDNAKLDDNFKFLRESTGVHIHADLIVGLPGESLESFAAGFDRLYELRPQEIQVGVLKRLRGAPIARHDEQWRMTYSPHPPYEILSNRLMSFEDIHRLRRFARHWDAIGNSGHFLDTLRLIIRPGLSAFAEFSRLCDWLDQRNPGNQSVSLSELYEMVFEYLVELDRLNMDTCGLQVQAAECRLSEQSIAQTVWNDYLRGGRRDRPAFLGRYELTRPTFAHASSLPARQGRHLKQ